MEWLYVNNAYDGDGDDSGRKKNNFTESMQQWYGMVVTQLNRNCGDADAFLCNFRVRV